MNEPDAAVELPPEVQAPALAPSVALKRYQNSTEASPEPLVLSEAVYATEMLVAELVEGRAVTVLVGAVLSRTVLASGLEGAASTLPETSVARV